MNFKKWLESYGPDAIYLKKYMLSRPLDLSNLFYEFMQWKGSKPLLQRLGIQWNKLQDMHDSQQDELYDILDDVEKKMSDKEKSDFIYSIRDYPSVHTWSYFDKPTMLRPDTWLIHFTDSAINIAHDGFTKGVDDMTRLGLTTHLSDLDKKYGGYNFAFIADSRDARNAARKNKYGKEAVMFQSAGVRAYHYGDEENQVIFWGKSVNPNKLVLLSRDYDNWCVSTMRMNRDCAHKGDFENVVDWVIENHQQYRHKIAGFGGKSEL
jgi:hypothetical protein